MLPLDDARRLILQVLAGHVVEAETLPLSQARGRILADDVRACIDVPAWDNAGMDGFALCAADLPEGDSIRLPIRQRIAAGSIPAPLEPGSAARIFTGAPLPAGADAVVMQEHCEWTSESVECRRLPRPGQAIRRRGEDVKAGQLVLSAGSKLSAQSLALAASVGHASLPVAPRPRVCVFSTGQELVSAGEPLTTGRLFDANRPMLMALLESWGAECSDRGILPDQFESTRQALRDAAQGHDLIICSGGVSVGEEDHVRHALQAEGQVDHWQIQIKPGKPLAFGRIERAGRAPAWMFGLPGNPVSSFVTALLLVAPFVGKLQGALNVMPQPLRLRAEFDWLKPDARREFLRVRRDGDALRLCAQQASHMLNSLVEADGLVDNPCGQVIRHGDWVDFLPFDGWSWW